MSLELTGKSISHTSLTRFLGRVDSKADPLLSSVLREEQPGILQDLLLGSEHFFCRVAAWCITVPFIKVQISNT